MLQQTQADRVVAKYESFLREFSNFAALSRARLQNVLELWHGLGYNKRALALKRIAQIVDTKFDGKLPSDYAALVQLPGVGRTTACAVRAFVFDAPEVFIETNIRAVFIHAFFADAESVKDDEIYPFVECTSRSIRSARMVLCAHGLWRDAQEEVQESKPKERSS